MAPDGKTRYVALPTGNKTVIARLSVHGGAVRSWADLDGSWGLPALTSFGRTAEGLSRDGKTLIVGRFGTGSPSRFLVVDTRLMRSVDSITLNGDYAYDALSPDASTLYLIQHVDANNINRTSCARTTCERTRCVPAGSRTRRSSAGSWKAAR